MSADHWWEPRRGAIALWCAAALLCAAPAPAVERPPSDSLYSRTYSGAEGLFASAIHAIAQDADGYLWLGADTGLIRFDGFAFTTWGTRGEPPLPGRIVMSLISARDGSLWVGFGDTGGVSRIQGGRLVHYNASQGVAVDWVLALIETQEGTILAGTRRGIARFRNDRWELLGAREGLPSAAVHSLYQDRSGAIWAGTAAGVFRQASEAEAFARVSPDVVQDFSEDPSGTMWVTDSRHAFRPLTQAGTPGHGGDGVAAGVGSRLFHDRHGTLWIGTSGQGLWSAPPGAAERLVATRVGLADQVISSVFEDRDGSIWVGMRGGLVRFFAHDVTMVTREQGLLSNTVRAIDTAPDGSVWVGTVEGLNHFAYVNGAPVNESYRLDNARVTALHVDRQGRVWVGTESGVATFTRGHLSRVPLPGVFNLGVVFAMTTDAEGALWLCHVGAAYPSRLFRGVMTDLDNVPEMHGRACTSVYTDRAGRVWLGFADGSLVASEQGAYRRYSSADGLTGGSIYSLWEDGGGSLWVGTSRGFSRVRDGRITSVLDRNGIPDTDVTALVGDQQGNLWCAFNGGLIRIKPSEVDRVEKDPGYRVQYVFLDASDGLLHPPTRYGFPTAALGGDGTLWFQTVNGVAAVNPRTLRPVQPARVRVERAVVDGRPLSAGSGGLTLPPRTSRVEIQYGAVSLGGASKVRFSYQLEGLDTAWVDAEARRQAYYTNLPPGEHRFRVRATMSGVDDTALWTFSIQPAFYQARWFYGLIALASVLSVWAAWQLRLRAMHGQFAVVLEERARIGREIHDTLLQTMAGTTLKLEGVAARLDASANPASADLRQIRRQLQRSVAEARESILHLRSAALDRQALSDALRASIDELIEDADVRVDVVEHGEPFASGSQVEQEVLRIAQEAVRNAIRHGGARRVRVELNYEPNGLRLRITDDGRGFDPEDPGIADGHRWGLIGMSERVHRMGGEFNITSQPGHGTAVEAIIQRAAVMAP